MKKLVNQISNFLAHPVVYALVFSVLVLADTFPPVN